MAAGAPSSATCASCIIMHRPALPPPQSRIQHDMRIYCGPHMPTKHAPWPRRPCGRPACTPRRWSRWSVVRRRPPAATYQQPSRILRRNRASAGKALERAPCRAGGLALCHSRAPGTSPAAATCGQQAGQRQLAVLLGAWVVDAALRESWQRRGGWGGGWHTAGVAGGWGSSRCEGG